MKRKWIGIFAIICISIVAACSNDKGQTEGEEPIITVETVEASKGDLVVEKTVYGRAQAGKTTPVMAQAQGEVEKLEVSDGDHVDKDDTIATLTTPIGSQKIKAEVSGEIMQLEVEEGDIITDAGPFALIVDLKEMQLDFAVTDQVRALVKKKDTLQVTIDKKEYDVEITTVSKLPGDTGLYPIKAKVKNNDDAILPGMVAELHIPEKRVKEAIILPTEAIVEADDSAFVYLVKDDRVRQVEITILAVQSDQTAIQGEIKEGDQVVINGQLTLTDGSKVSTVKEGNES